MILGGHGKSRKIFMELWTLRIVAKRYSAGVSVVE